MRVGICNDAELGEMPESSLPIVDAAAVIDALGSRMDSRMAYLAFDADGTLWTGDVSDDVFLSACGDEWLLDAAEPELIRHAQQAGLSTRGSASQLALALFECQKLVRIREDTLYALMAWCYAGRTLEEFQSYAAQVLTRKNLDRRIRPEILEILAWAKSHGLPCYIVSASPTPIVTWAAEKWGFSPEHVIGTMPEIVDNVIEPKLADEVPFGANKCKLLKRRTGSMHCLASFGDSEFDFELLAGAECAVAVSPKAGLLARLQTLTHAVVLRTGA